MDMKLHDGSATIEIDEKIFSADFNEGLIHQVVNAFLARARSGTKAQKTKAEVSGGGIKPWRQKGTGRARAGSIRSPIWVGGGRAFAAKPRSYEQKVNKKMYRAAMRSILSELVRQDRLHAVEKIAVSSPKTKEYLSLLDQLGLKGRILVVVDQMDESLYLASRNIYWSAVVDARSINPHMMVSYDHVVVETEALKNLEGRYK